MPSILRFRPRLGFLAAPGCAAALVLWLAVLEDRQFNANSALLLALALAIAVADSVPFVALAFAGGALVAQAASVFPSILVAGVLPYSAVPFVVFFATLGHRGPRRWVLPVSAVFLAAVATVSWFQDGPWINFIFGTHLYGRGMVRSLTVCLLILGAFAAVNLGAWALGVAVSAASASRRAQLRAEARLRETTTALAVEQERSRIAAELHDVLAHSLAVVIAQAEGIRYIHRIEPESVEASATVIAEAARSALVETRRMLEGTKLDLSVATVTNGIEMLAQRLTSSGMTVRLSEEGNPDKRVHPYGPAVHRVVQESLTNAFKHGDRGAGADVGLNWHPGGVIVRIESTLPADTAQPSGEAVGASGTGSGRGIPGMAARANASGGWLNAFSTDTHFIVSASIGAPLVERMHS